MEKSSVSELSGRHPVQSPRRQFERDVLRGLRDEHKYIHSKYFYDEQGSRLFERITELDEYYLTRTELSIMKRHGQEMGEQIGPRVMLVEYGSGSSVKTRVLLDHLQDPVAYVPVDISAEHLQKSAESLQRDYPEIEVLPVAADFTKAFRLPDSSRSPSHAAVYFPGSTIGNFSAVEAQRLLSHVVPLCGTGGGLLIGIDLQKDPAVIEAAYNDAEGVTACFNLNLLQRINRELGADFDLLKYRHLAIYEPGPGRVETFIVSERKQGVTVAGRKIEFEEGERIHTEYSHKYTVAGFAQIAAVVGLELHRSWIDDRDYFAVLHLVVG